MKIIVCVLALVLAINASPVSRDFGVAVKHFYNKLKDQMPCGIKGSKSLAPFVWDGAGVDEDPFEFQLEGYEFFFDLNKVKVENLDTFNIVDSVYNKDTNQYKMKFILPQLALFANYTFNHKLDTKYLTGSFHHNGSVTLDLTDKSQYELSFYFNHNKTSGDLIVEKFNLTDSNSTELKFDFGDNEEIAGEVKDFFKKMEKEFGVGFDDVYDDYMSSKLNKLFVGRKTVEEAADYFYKISGNSTHGPFEEPLCNHV
ncbi:hypothetical protein ACFFRR_006441 [Megaselia abdita]